MKKYVKIPALFLVGGSVYYLLEIGFRGHSYLLMGVIGGICFVLIGLLDSTVCKPGTPLLLQGTAGAVAVTCVELASGLVCNRWLGLGLWDYSRMPLNLCGQVCLPFSLMWIVLSMAGVAADHWLKWILFGEEKPKFCLLAVRKKRRAANSK